MCHVYIWLFSNNINYINIDKFSSLSNAIIAKFNWGQNSTSLGTKTEHKGNQENVYLATTRNHTLLHKNLMHSCFLRERIFKLVCIFLYLSALLLTFALYPNVDFFSRVNKGTLINPHDVWIKTLLISKYGGKKSEEIFPLDLNSISHESKC